MDELGSPSSPPQPPPMTIDGADQDLALANSRFLTRQEVLRRRHRRVKQLARCYRGIYWALMEDLKSKFRDYYWNYGKSPFKEDENRNDRHKHADGAAVSGDNVNGINGHEKAMMGGSDAVGDDIIRCASGGCKSKAMALTKFCHSHILLDSKQKLYQECRTVAKNLPTGRPSFCNKPALRSMVPPACPNHYQLGEKCLIRAIKRAGYTIPTNRKANPKLHVIVSEFVRQIQIKRKVALKAAVSKAENE